MKPKVITPDHLERMVEIGIRIKKLRVEKKLSYITMAHEIGISRNGYNSIELGKVYFNFVSLMLICDYHQISVSDLLQGL